MSRRLAAGGAPNSKPSKQPTSTGGAPLSMKTVAAMGRFSPVLARAIASRLKISAVVCNPDKQSGPRRIEVPFFVAPGNGSTRGSVSKYLRRRGRLLMAGGDDAGDC